MLCLSKPSKITLVLTSCLLTCLADPAVEVDPVVEVDPAVEVDLVDVVVEEEVAEVEVASLLCSAGKLRIRETRSLWKLLTKMRTPKVGKTAAFIKHL